MAASDCLTVEGPRLVFKVKDVDNLCHEIMPGN
jgi:hypothetical protein